MSDDAKILLGEVFRLLTPGFTISEMDLVVKSLRQSDDPELRSLLTDGDRVEEVEEIAAENGCGGLTVLDLRTAFAYGAASLQRSGPSHPPEPT